MSGEERMEMAVDEKRVTQKVASKKGGLRAMPFIIANEAFEKVAGVGLQANMILYLRNEYSLSNASGAYIMSLVEKLRLSLSLLGFLNKAAVIGNPEKNLDCDGLAIDPWRLCTVNQVEELKSLIKVLPICPTGIMIAVTLNQHAFPVLQATTMDRHFIGNLKRPRGQSNKQRVGIGTVISCIATVTAGAVENKPLATALRQGLADHPRAVVDIVCKLANSTTFSNKIRRGFQCNSADRFLLLSVSDVENWKCDSRSAS
ncbi:hypothetical protein SADUNF_Sadunf12G0066400 [Salix dunnii]|uniref:Uncharacterized protein n=1 Tax=Salix dunnii TaxID=1413687 RepID=A0A835MW12_9ROSI|nr:hypothetical protein SADUNF_Sadunf12G0066400 [Salix dunnii]